ncbi:hypothetical protein HYC85_007183 [Camellia sinensis]|uniref:Uncharacterized protein n=1 Tax=Camellia sinensis TaxID=4442 RepID=A0A7J7HPH8_CAMSI|nr:hypothetical protein HYC85_007183 [Camellia sinensis]
MASAHEFPALTNMGITHTSLPQRYHLFLSQYHWKLTVQSCSWVSVTIHNIQNPRLFKSVELDRFLTSDDEDEMSEGFFEPIEELERMTREPSGVLEEMNGRLSAHELQRVLV